MKDTITTMRDCFAYDERKCRVLKERYCDSGKCNFYKKATDTENSSECDQEGGLTQNA